MNVSNNACAFPRDSRTSRSTRADPADGSGVSLTDGVYAATLDHTKVSSNGVPLAADAGLTFHRLFGDTDGNKVVNNADYLKLKRSFNAASGQSSYNAGFDSDGNGVVNNADYLQFKKRFGITFAYP